MGLSALLTVRLPTLLAIFLRAHTKRHPVHTNNRGAGQRFIIYRLDGMGDVVMTTPLFRELKRAEPESRCTVVVQEAWRTLLETNPYIDELLTVPSWHAGWLPERARKLLSAILFYGRELRGRHFDVAISPRWDTDEDLATFLCALTDAPCRMGYSEKTSPAKQRFNRGFERAFDVCLSPGPVKHEALRNLAMAEALGGAIKDTNLEIFLTREDRKFAASLWSTMPSASVVIALGIGARSANRRWPLENYAQLISRMAESRNVQPIIVCGPAEHGAAQRLANQLSQPAVVVSGRQIRQTCAVLERCQLFIGNDSGCAHLAAAMNCKALVISPHPRSGDPNHSNSPLRFAPYCEQAVVLQPSKGLGNCTTGCCSHAPHCITQVSVDEVVTAALDLLARKPSQPATTVRDIEVA